MSEARTPALDRAGIAATYELIRPHVRATPVVEANGADFGLARFPIRFKLELLQHAGSFKSRGAFANLLLRQVPAAGVVAASGGNHGAAVAYAAKTRSIRARIFVPSVSSPAKRALIESYGAELVVTGERYAEALTGAERAAAETGALQIHAYDQVETMLGQGSVGLEFESQVPELETLFVAVGGGGLIGVEPEAAPTLFKALEAGKPVDAEAGGIAADSLAPRQVGQLMFPIAQRYVARVILVPDAAIRAAQEALWRGLHVVTEPGGAAAFAPLLSGLYSPKPGERVGVLLCGANTTAVDFSR